MGPIESFGIDGTPLEEQEEGDEEEDDDEDFEDESTWGVAGSAYSTSSSSSASSSAAAAAAAAAAAGAAAAAAAGAAAGTRSAGYIDHANAEESNEAALAAAAAAASGRPSRLMEELGVALQGYLLKKCRTMGDRKPFKKRFFVLRGASLLYYATESEAKAGKELPKVLIHLDDAVRICDAATESVQHAFSLQHSNNVKSLSARSATTTTTTTTTTLPSASATAATIPSSSSSSSSASKSAATPLLVVAATSAEQKQQWLLALDEARRQPICILPHRDGAGGSGSGSGTGTLTRIKMSVAASVASSSLGRSLITRYLEPCAREFIAGLLMYAERQKGAKLAALYHRVIFDVCARIAVVVHERKLPADLDIMMLHSETLSFTQVSENDIL